MLDDLFLAVKTGNLDWLQQCNNDPGIDFNSLDGEKTYLFFLLLSDSEVIHLKILSKLTQILSIPGNAQEVLELDSTTAFLKFFIESEGKL